LIALEETSEGAPQTTLLGVKGLKTRWGEITIIFGSLMREMEGQNQKGRGGRIKTPQYGFSVCI